MVKRVEFSAKQKDQIKAALKNAKSKEEYQRALCLWLRAEQGLGARQIARTLGMSFGGVRNIHSRYFRKGESILTNAPIGGRLHAHMSVEEEGVFLSPFEEAAQKSGILTVSTIRRAYEKLVGQKVPESTVYRMLARHGWRKVAPRPAHPKSDPVAQEAFKKTSPRGDKSSNAWTKSR